MSMPLMAVHPTDKCQCRLSLVGLLSRGGNLTTGETWDNVYLYGCLVCDTDNYTVEQASKKIEEISRNTYDAAK